ncbi:MAG: T9SS type A sorting domain-containing protein [Bacteroidetes bacterium]|nr:MAG: T9SS type A sorting domain-containing protein [Bacteroidota bacterium]
MTKLLLSAISLFIASISFSQYQIYKWGAEATSNGVSAGQFQNDFIETSGTTLSTTEWTARTISDGNGNGAASHAFWKRTTTPYSQGSSSDLVPLNSPSVSNGVAIFDSEYLDNSGIAPGIQKGELISPLIDLTGYTDSALSLKMYLKYDAVNFIEASVSFSRDNGLTWQPAVDLVSNHPHRIEGITSVQFPGSTLNGVPNLTSCRIKFTFEGAYNYIMLDDVSLFTGGMTHSGIFTDIESFQTIEEHTCSSYTSPSGNYTWSTSGTYYDTIPNSFNRDSMMMIQLSVGAPNTGVDAQIACDSYQWIDGNTYTASNTTAQHTLQNVSGCDSVVTLNLTMNYSSSATQSETGLDSYTWPINNQTYTASGQYTATIPNAAGCDSLITLDLTMNFTGLDEQQLVTVQLYPNPVKEVVTLKANKVLNGSYSIVDVNGRMLITGELNEAETIIPVPTLKPGTYFIHFEQYSSVLKFVKE